MKILLKMILAILINSAINSTNLNKSISSGHTLNITDAPYQVQIIVETPTNPNYTVSKCSGAIISDRWALTSAYMLAVCKRYNCTINLRSESGLWGHGGRTHVVRDVILHERFRSPSRTGKDIALVLVDSFLAGSTIARPIPLADYLVSVGTPIRIAGWGNTSCDPNPTDQMKAADLFVIDRATCTLRYKDNIVHRKLYESMLCADGDDAPIIYDDSGNAVVADGVLIGLFSWGSPCHRPRPRVYTDVSQFIPWIEKHIYGRNLSNSTSGLAIYSLHPKVNITEYSYHVALSMVTWIKNVGPIKTRCSGVIVGDHWVVTAAYCIVGCRFHPCDIEVRAESSIWNDGGRRHNCDRIFFIENFTSTSLYDHDIALLYTNTSIIDGSSIARAISLSDSPTPSGAFAHLTAWGFKGCHDYSIPGLKIVRVAVVNPTLCEPQNQSDQMNATEETSPKHNYNSARLWHPSTICARLSEPKALLGDLGSPVVANGTLVGIVSLSSRCKSEQQLYRLTNITHFRSWILTRISIGLD